MKKHTARPSEPEHTKAELRETVDYLRDRVRQTRESHLDYKRMLAEAVKELKAMK